MSMVEQYTSTGSKLWHHPEAMDAYREGLPYTVISTHISPEGRCNLKCKYCSVWKRNQLHRLPLETIKDYVRALRINGLKAVILTGGGEPTLYPDFNELMEWLAHMGIEVGLITNGTRTYLVHPDVWGMFAWVRVSLNVFSGWMGGITLPRGVSSSCTVGCSFIWSEDMHDSVFSDVSWMATKLGAEYVRFLPDCTLPPDELAEAHTILEEKLKKLADPRFFHQWKVHRTPKAEVCHQSFFRPYLCETGIVYPCDSVVLNGTPGQFEEKFALCEAKRIISFLNHRADGPCPREDCPGCVFADTVDMLDDWKAGTLEPQKEVDDHIHPNFV